MKTELQGRAAYVAEIRERAEADMQRIGIDAAFIGILVETFYARIRSHPDLGPIFDARLAGKWPDHLGRMKRFWSSVALRDGSYGGKPVQAHLSVDGLTADLFPEWLSVFSATLDDIAPSSAAHDWFMATAERIARSLTLSLFYNPAVDSPVRKPA
jgi:hemoglobin